MKHIPKIKGIDITMTILDQRKINKKVSELMAKREKIVFELDRLKLKQFKECSELFKSIVKLSDKIEKVKKGIITKHKR